MKRTSIVALLLACTHLLCSTGPAHATVIFGNSALSGGSRWDAAPRNINGLERSLDDGLRFSLQGGSYQAYRDLFTWDVVPSVADFQAGVDSAFDAWTVADPTTGLGTDLTFVFDDNTVALGTVTGGGVNANGAEIDLFGSTNANSWDPGDPGRRAEAFFDAIGDNVTLTSGTANYPGSFSISGADITMNSNSGAVYDLQIFTGILTHEIGHSIGLGDVDVFGPDGRFIDDDFDPTSSATALATLTNPWANLVNPFDPSASPLALFTVANADPGVDTPGVDILMETNIPASVFGNPQPLANDDFGGRQFLYPHTTGCFDPNGSLPPVDCEYLADIHQSFDLNGIPINFDGIAHKAFENIIFSGDDLDSVGETQTESFDSVVEGILTIGGPNPFNGFVSLPAGVLVDVELVQVAGSTRVFSTEMLTLDIFLDAIVPGAMITLDPNNPTLGLTTAIELDGTFLIESFFDVFTQLSMGGNNFPSLNGSSRVTAFGIVSTPAPTTFSLLCAGLVVFGYLRRGSGGI